MLLSKVKRCNDCKAPATHEAKGDINAPIAEFLYYCAKCAPYWSNPFTVLPNGLMHYGPPKKPPEGAGGA